MSGAVDLTNAVRLSVGMYWHRCWTCPAGCRAVKIKGEMKNSVAVPWVTPRTGDWNGLSLRARRDAGKGKAGDECSSAYFEQ